MRKWDRGEVPSSVPYEMTEMKMKNEKPKIGK